MKRNREAERVAPTVSICTNSKHCGSIKHVSHLQCLNLSYHGTLTVTAWSTCHWKAPIQPHTQCPLFCFLWFQMTKHDRIYKFWNVQIKSLKSCVILNSIMKALAMLLHTPSEGCEPHHLLRVSKISMSPYTTCSPVGLQPTDSVSR